MLSNRAVFLNLYWFAAPLRRNENISRHPQLVYYVLRNLNTCESRKFSIFLDLVLNYTIPETEKIARIGSPKQPETNIMTRKHDRKNTNLKSCK
jgi:hypothetical protein